MFLTPSRLSVGSLSHNLLNRPMAALSCMAAIACCISSNSFAQSSETEDPVTVLSDGLVTVIPSLLEDGYVLEIGASLLPGDVVVDGALLNTGVEPKLVIVEGQLSFIDPGHLLFTGGLACACKCGPSNEPGGWIIQPVYSPNCAEWGILSGKVGRPCVHPLTFELLTYTECAAADAIPGF